jgi:Tol biopolymer transport system component
VWVTEGAQINRFTIEGGGLPIWSPDGRHIAFGADRNGSRSLFQKPAAGGTEIALLQTSAVSMLSDWSPDGRFILYTSLGSETGADLSVLPLDGDRKPFSFLTTRFAEIWGQFSPDGHWVAYQSNEAGQRYEIYLRPFPVADGQWQVSMAGGVSPRWAPDGKELYYFAPDGKLMAAAIAVRGITLEIGARTPLFQPRIVGGGTSIVGHRQQYAVAPDGRFLLNVAQDNTSELPITLILNWKPKP